MIIAALRDQDREWTLQSWGFAKQILPLLLGGVFIAGFALGRPGHEGIIPSEWVAMAVGDNTLTSTVIASVLGALMYFSTLTEVPIVDALMGSVMGKGPARALLLAGPALSLPNMLVIRTILGTQKNIGLLCVGCGDGHHHRICLWQLVVIPHFKSRQKRGRTMKFTVYGSGCSKCKQLTLNAEQAAKAKGLQYEVEKVADTNAIIDAGIVRTPALAIDGETVIEGKVANADEIQQLLV